MPRVLPFLILLTACEHFSVYGVTARDAETQEPVFGARLFFSCGYAPAQAADITDDRGKASDSLMNVSAVPSTCELKLRRPGYLIASTQLAPVCTDWQRNRTCGSAEWLARLVRDPAALPSRESSAARTPPPRTVRGAADCAGSEDAWLSTWVPLHRDLRWRSCGQSTSIRLIQAETSRLLAEVSIPGVDHLKSAAPDVIGNDASWIPIVAEKDDLETLLVLRAGDDSALTVAYRSDPAAKGKLAFVLEDLDGDGDPELRVRTDGEASSLKQTGGVFRAWDHPRLGPVEGAAAEVCAWDEQTNGANTCDPLLDLNADAREMADGTKLLLVQWPRGAGYRQSAAFIVRGDQARLAWSANGWVMFIARAGCFVHHEVFSWFSDIGTFCYRNGAVKQE